MDITQSIHSIGSASAVLQIMPQKIRSTAVELGIEPALVINNVEHYSEESLERIRKHLKQEKKPASKFR